GMRDRAATRALVLGLLALPFGVFSPFAIWSGARSLRRIRASGGAERRGLRRRGPGRRPDRAGHISGRNGLLALHLVIARLVIGLLIVVIGAFTYPGELIVSLATRIAPQAPAAAGPEGAMPWLHVAHPSGGRPYIADDKNRLVLLHGAIPASLLDFGPGP